MISKELKVVIDEVITNRASWILESPYRKEAIQFLETALSLGKGSEANSLRILLCFKMYHWCDQVIFPNSQQPIEDFKSLLNDFTDWLNETKKRMVDVEYSSLASGQDFSKEEKTKKYYGELFKDYSHQEYCEEPYNILKTRFERNNIDISKFEGLKALDGGCGGGRYSAALSRFGFSEVTAIDFSPINVKTVKRNTQKFGIDNIKVQQASALELPFEDDTFDFVFSNGVLHHTANIQQGVNELVRVLKPGGLGWLYLIQDPGGIYWEFVDLLRIVVRDVPFDYAKAVLKALGLPESKIFYELDHVYVPINYRSTEEEMVAYVTKAGGKDIVKLARGCDYDHSEKVFQDIAGAREKYGVGEQRYIFSK